MKKFINKIREWFNWIFNKEVFDAINDGKSYEEVEAIARKGIK